MTESDQMQSLPTNPDSGQNTVIDSPRQGLLAATIRKILLLSGHATIALLVACNNGSSNDGAPDDDDNDDDDGPQIILGENLGVIGNPVVGVTAADADMDGDLDILATTGHYAWVYENVSLDRNPVFSEPRIYAFFAHFSDYRILHDLDGDGDLDAFVSAGNRAYGSPPVWYQQNVGSNSEPSYQDSRLLENNECVGDWMSAELGDKHHYMALADIDADSDLDLFIGDKGDEIRSGKFGFCENTGNTSSPHFANAVTDDPFGLETGGMGANYVAFGDMDNDGDYDAWVNHDSADFEYYRGEYVVYENTGTVNAPSFTRVASDSEGTHGFPVQGCPYPHFVDLDGDGLLDGLCSNGVGVAYLKGGDAP